MVHFCENCREFNEYYVKDVDLEKEIKGEKYYYKGKQAYCAKCNDELFVDDIIDYNLKQINYIYREKNNIIKTDKIEEILKLYNIGKKPLSLLLDWGEATVIRYLNGDIPSKLYSDLLIKIYEDPNYMEEILENNKEKISELAYKKCKAAIEEIKKSKLNKQYNIDRVTDYFLYIGEDITPLALQKMLYYAQGFYKTFYNKYLFNDDCEGWVHGPVYRKIYNKYNDYKYNCIEKFKINTLNDIPFNDRAFLDEIFKCFGCYSGKVLEKMTHSEAPWQQSRIELNDLDQSNIIIEKDWISSYFNNIKNKFQMLTIYDIEDYSLNLFKKIHN